MGGSIAAPVYMMLYVTHLIIYIWYVQQTWRISKRHGFPLPHKPSFPAGGLHSCRFPWNPTPRREETTWWQRDTTHLHIIACLYIYIHMYLQTQINKYNYKYIRALYIYISFAICAYIYIYECMCMLQILYFVNCVWYIVYTVYCRYCIYIYIVYCISYIVDCTLLYIVHVCICICKCICV